MLQVELPLGREAHAARGGVLQAPPAARRQAVAQRQLQALRVRPELHALGGGGAVEVGRANGDGVAAAPVGRARQLQPGGARSCVVAQPRPHRLRHGAVQLLDALGALAAGQLAVEYQPVLDAAEVPQR